MLTNLPAILRQARLLDAAQEASVIEQCQASGQSVPEALLTLNLIENQQLTEQLAHIFGLPKVEIDQFDYVAICQKLGLRELITRHQALPLYESAQQLTIAIADPTNLELEDEFRFATGRQIELVSCRYKSAS